MRQVEVWTFLCEQFPWRSLNQSKFRTNRMWIMIGVFQDWPTKLSTAKLAANQPSKSNPRCFKLFRQSWGARRICLNYFYNLHWICQFCWIAYLSQTLYFSICSSFTILPIASNCTPWLKFNFNQAPWFRITVDNFKLPTCYQLSDLVKRIIDFNFVKVLNQLNRVWARFFGAVSNKVFNFSSNLWMINGLKFNLGE